MVQNTFGYYLQGKLPLDWYYNFPKDTTYKKLFP